MLVCVLRGTEEVFQALEDNQVTLSVMKASRFAKAFEKEVDHWERCLSLVLEVIEMILTVQRQWMYLEVRTHTALPTVLYSTLLIQMFLLCFKTLVILSRYIHNTILTFLTPGSFLINTSHSAMHYITEGSTLYM